MAHQISVNNELFRKMTEMKDGRTHAELIEALILDYKKNNINSCQEIKLEDVVDMLIGLAEQVRQLCDEPIKKSPASVGWLKNWCKLYKISMRFVTDDIGSTRYMLEECPFNPTHKFPDVRIIGVHASQKAVFHCEHCKNHTWEELKELIETKRPVDNEV